MYAESGAYWRRGRGIADGAETRPAFCGGVGPREPQGRPWLPLPSPHLLSPFTRPQWVPSFLDIRPPLLQVSVREAKLKLLLTRSRFCSVLVVKIVGRWRLSPLKVRRRVEPIKNKLTVYENCRLLNFLRMDVPSEGRCVTFSSSVESGILGHLPSIKDHTGNHAVFQNDYHSYYHYGTNYPIFTSHSRHDHCWWLSRRISGDSFGMLNSWRMTANPVPYNPLPLVHTRSNFLPTSAFHQVGNCRSPYRLERIEAADLLGDPPMPITLGSTCGLCQELLKDSSPLCEELLTSTEVSVVAVLVCGHLYLQIV